MSTQCIFLLIKYSIDPTFCGIFVCGPLQFKCQFKAFEVAAAQKSGLGNLFFSHQTRCLECEHPVHWSTDGHNWAYCTKRIQCVYSKVLRDSCRASFSPPQSWSQKETLIAGCERHNPSKNSLEYSTRAANQLSINMEVFLHSYAKYPYLWSWYETLCLNSVGSSLLRAGFSQQFTRSLACWTEAEPFQMYDDRHLLWSTDESRAVGIKFSSVGNKRMHSCNQWVS